MGKRKGFSCRCYVLGFLVAAQAVVLVGLLGLNSSLPLPSSCLPPDSEGYIVEERHLHRIAFDVVATCAPGYKGKAKVTPCLLPSTQYKLSGCLPGDLQAAPSPPAPVPVPAPVPAPARRFEALQGALPRAAGARGSATPAISVHLDLKLPDSMVSKPTMQDHTAMFRQYGFNLKKSNELGLVREPEDLRNEFCRARTWPKQLPQTSVIIIFYNEALSTLLRNVLMLLNLTPAELLGEILLVDDHSDLEELSLLPEHLDRLHQSVGKDKVRLIRRETHDGIVGARNRGAKEARFPVIVILDSHAEVTVGWLEPLLARIHEDRKRVVVPNIVAMNIETLDFIGGTPWPPIRGIFNWRLTFIGTAADPALDLLEKDVPPKASVVHTPVMPGGLFAMDREFYWEIGGYDPEIRYYGAEHVEMSFRVWMCGGSMETTPCSNIGHIYREFDRFGVDRQLKGNVYPILDRNDARVAEVWMDDYKELFFKYRNMKKGDLGPQLDERKELREKLQCKPFSWFLEKICRDLYIPDEDTEVGNMYSLGGAGCITGGKEQHGPALLAECTSGGEQKIEFTSQNYMQVTAHVNHHLVCLRTQMVAQVPCRKGTQWQLEGKELHSLDREGFCLTRSPSGEAVDLVKCKALARQQWSFEGKGVLSGPAGDLCVDNMQRTSGPPGLYGCHGGTTQQWILDPDHRLRSGGVCLGIQPSVAIAPCVPEDDAFAWLRRSTTQHDRLGMQTFSPRNNPELCLVGQDHKMRLGECEGDQKFWKYPFNA